MLSATLTSARWPAAWSTRSLLPTHAPDTVLAGMPSFSGSPSLTCLPVLLILGWSWCCHVPQRACNSWSHWRNVFEVNSLLMPFCVILMLCKSWLQKNDLLPFKIPIFLISIFLHWPWNDLLLQLLIFIYVHNLPCICLVETFRQCERK